MESNRLLPVVIVLAIGLAGTSFLYIDARNVDSPVVNTSIIDGLNEDLTEAQSVIEGLEGENDGLEEEVAGLEEVIVDLEDEKESLSQQVSELEQIEVPQPRPDIVIDVSDDGEVKNVILLIGDGLGIGQLTAAEVMNGEDDLVQTSLPYTTLVTTHSESNYVTDSAASATALATGFKTRNGMVGMASDREYLFTVLEDAEHLGKATGVVTTTRVTHATPASFFAHVIDRGKEEIIAGQLLESGVDVALGGGNTYFEDLNPEEAGYTIVYDADSLDLVDSGMVLGLFSEGYMNYESARPGSGQPSLTDMTNKALDILSEDEDGFFLMIEGGRIDHASHANDFDNAVTETLVFDEAVLVALEYASNRDDTLVIVTSDHETGGISIVGGYQSGGGMQLEWISDDHIGSLVPVYAYGPRASEIVSFRDNTDIGAFLLSVIE